MSTPERDDETTAPSSHPGRAAGLPVWVIVLLAWAGLGLLGGAAVVAVKLLMVRNGGGVTHVGIGAPIKTFHRDEFRSLVLGKARGEVAGLIGEPDSAGEHGGKKTWVYRSRTVDPTTGRTDPAAVLHFAGEKVESVTYE